MIRGDQVGSMMRILPESPPVTMRRPSGMLVREVMNCRQELRANHKSRPLQKSRNSYKYGFCYVSNRLETKMLVVYIIDNYLHKMAFATVSNQNLSAPSAGCNQFSRWCFIKKLRDIALSIMGTYCCSCPSVDDQKPVGEIAEICASDCIHDIRIAIAYKHSNYTSE